MKLNSRRRANGFLYSCSRGVDLNAMNRRTNLDAKYNSEAKQRTSSSNLR